jgi:hypothetical protein
VVIFWDITPCIMLKVNRRFVGTYRLHLQGRRISRARYREKHTANRSSTLKMEATCSAETSIDCQRTTRRYIPEDGALLNIHMEFCWRYLLVEASEAPDMANSKFFIKTNTIGQTAFVPV